jgi:PAS domain S-box-containing protein
LLARWLWLSLVRSVRLRFVAAIVAALVLLATVVASALTQVIGNNLRDEELTRLELAAQGQQDAIGRSVQEGIRVSSTIAQGLADRFADPTRLRGFARAIFLEARGLLPTGADFLVFVNGTGQVVDSAREVPVPGSSTPTYQVLDPVEEIALAGSDVLRGALGAGAPPERSGDVVPVGLSKIAAVGASPVQGTGRKLLGAVVVGFDLDRELLVGLKAGAEAEITILKGGAVISTTFEDPRAARALSGGSLYRRARRVVEEQGGIMRATAALSRERAFAVYVPIRTDDQQRIVGVLALSRPAGLLDASQRSINRTLFLITLAAAAVAAMLAWLLSGRVTRPIRALTSAARQVRGGDLDVRATVDAPDEVGTLGAAFNDMAMSLKRMTDDLRSAADEEANLRARMEAIMQSMGDALVATDTEGTIVAFNRAAEQMLGMESPDVIGRRLTDVLTGDSASGRPLAELALQGGGGGTAAVLGPDGRRVPVAMTGAPLLDAAGQAVGRVVVLRDVSREQEAERMKTEFLSNVSHELRTPLTPIKGYTEILRRKRFPRDKAITFLDGIAESTKRLERIVEILVDFAAIEAGRLKPHLEPIDLRAFVTKILEPWRGRAPNHRFVRSIPAELPPILGDERLLRKCLDELIDNAVKFSPDGGDIEIEGQAAFPSGRRRARPTTVRVAVRDAGIGIEPNQMTNLFQDFRQLDGSDTRSFGGLGLGLSYAKRVAIAHHGDITAASEPGRGSVFTIVLPAAPASVQSIKKKQPQTSTRTIAKSSITRKRVAAAATSKSSRKPQQSRKPQPSRKPQQSRKPQPSRKPKPKPGRKAAAGARRRTR